MIMRMLQATTIKKPKEKRKGRKVILNNGTVLTLCKNLPKKCSVPRRICIKCLKTVIKKHSKEYESKVCKDCK